MFDKWQIKERMEVVDFSGQHVGTIDHIDGDALKLTRRDTTDGRHHFIDVDCIDRIENERVVLKQDVPLPEDFRSDASLTPEAIAADYDSQSRDGSAKNDTPLFGTSGHGTGMGGSGPT